MRNIYLLSERDYVDLFKLASDAIWIHDLEGKITAGNQAFEKMTGYPMDRLLGMNVEDFLSGDALALAHLIKCRLLKGEPITGRYEQRIIRGDGSDVIVEITTRLIKENDQPVAFQNIARDVTEERRIRDNLRSYWRKVLVAQEEERKRIARDLHDDIIQSLLLLVHRLGAISPLVTDNSSGTIKDQLDDLHALALEIIKNLRRYSQGLRPVILDDLGLAASLEWMADNLSTEIGIDVNVQLDAHRNNLSRDLQLTLFRIAQEAIVNIRKHAEASKVTIRLETGKDVARLIISDNGKGFEVPPRLSDLGAIGRLGLLGIQERVQLLGGTVRISSAKGKGTTVSVEIQNQPTI